MSRGTGRLQENTRIFGFVKIHKKDSFSSTSKIFYAEFHCMKYRIKWKNKNFDVMGTLTQATRLPDYPFQSDHAGSFGNSGILYCYSFFLNCVSVLSVGIGIG